MMIQNFVDLSMTPLTYGIITILLTSTILLLYNNYYNNTNTNKNTIVVKQINIYPVKTCSEISMKKAMAKRGGFELDRLVQITNQHGKLCEPHEKAKLLRIQTELLQNTDDGAATGPILKLSSYNMKEPLVLNWRDCKNHFPVTVETMYTPSVRLFDFGNDAANWMERASGIVGCRVSGIGKDYRREVQVNPNQGDALPPMPLPLPSSPSSFNGKSTTKVSELNIDLSIIPVHLGNESPYLLTNTASLVDLNCRLKSRNKSIVDMRRFRPNIIISGNLLRPWEEDTWRKIKVGKSMKFWVWQRCGRCSMTTINRNNWKRDDGPEPLSTLSTFRERSNGMRNFGMHLIPVHDNEYNNDDDENENENESENDKNDNEYGEDGRSFELCVGDSVEVLEYDEERRAEWSKLFS